MSITIVLIATKRYKEFVSNLVESIKKHFLLRHKIEIVIFTDDIQAITATGDHRVSIVKDLIVSWGFPQATLYRYKIITSRTYNTDYLYYLDVDYLIINEIDEEFLGNIVAVRHPGFFSGVNGPGSWCDDPASNAYTFKENRKFYYCGGTQGGLTSHYYRIAKRLAWEIEDDEKRGIKPEWNDESYWNRYLSELNSFKTLNPSYCMVEQPELRTLWKISHIHPRILALAKNHEEYQK